MHRLPADLVPLGTGLNRPECVLATRSGHLLASDWSGDGGVAVLAPDGRLGHCRVRRQGQPPLRPNGIAIDQDASLLLAHLGAEDGGVFRLWPDGTAEPVLTHVDGRALPPTNYPHLDEAGRLWISVSTRRSPRALDYRPDACSGFVVLLDRKGARIVADGLGYANECLLSPDGRHLYVNETFGRRMVRFPLRGDGLGDAETVAVFGEGSFPDGLTFDAEGGIWVTSIVSNRLLRIHPDGRQEVVIEDVQDAHLAQVEARYREGTMGRPELDRVRSCRLANISSLAFGGPDLRTAYLGCLLGTAVERFTAPVAGHPPSHWPVDLSPLLSQVDFA